ncbi:MAG: hypothetical protein LBF40_05865 [Deltaproteobacteria bacterium]|jgi:hypothetical protein|nr:hypothetical protein [Deltaproteobacteria bacterium]
MSVLLAALCLSGYLYAQVSEDTHAVVPKKELRKPREHAALKFSDDSIALADIDSKLMDVPIKPIGLNPDLSKITLLDLIKAAIEIQKDNGINLLVYPENATNFFLSGENLRISLIQNDHAIGFKLIDPTIESNPVTFSVSCVIEKGDNFDEDKLCEHINIEENGKSVGINDAYSHNSLFLRAIRESDD